MDDKLKESIIKIATEWHSGMNLDGVIIPVFGKKYYVDVLNNEVEEIK